MPVQPEPQRDLLPIPTGSTSESRPSTRKDPDTSFPPIELLRPPDDAPNVLVILVDDRARVTLWRVAKTHPHMWGRGAGRRDPSPTLRPVRKL
jgi:hypothetical protein